MIVRYADALSAQRAYEVGAHLAEVMPGQYQGVHAFVFANEANLSKCVVERHALTFHVSALEYAALGPVVAWARALGYETSVRVVPATWAQWVAHGYRPLRQVSDRSSFFGVEELSFLRRRLPSRDWAAATNAQRYDNWYTGPKLVDLVLSEIPPLRDQPALTDSCRDTQGLCNGTCTKR
jgi:hypothetical protein